MSGIRLSHCTRSSACVRRDRRVRGDHRLATRLGARLKDLGGGGLKRLDRGRRLEVALGVANVVERVARRRCAHRLDCSLVEALNLGGLDRQPVLLHAGGAHGGAIVNRAVGLMTEHIETPLSIADIAVTCQFIQMMYAGESLPESNHPNIARYVSNHMRRDSFKGLINNDPFIKVE